MKSKEELLSEETRAAADLASRFLQWGVTLMISIQTALFFCPPRDSQWLY
jgi:hypothetical protein